MVGLINQATFWGGGECLASVALIENSLLFNDDDNAYLSRTPVGVGNTTTWTFSTWIKRANLGGEQGLFGTFDSNLNVGWFVLTPNEQLNLTAAVGGSISIDVTTEAVFRDPSTWIHIVLVWDTNNTISADRIRIYINGSRVDVKATTNSVPDLGASAYINSTDETTVGRTTNNAFQVRYMDGYMSDTYFIDGLALDPTEFGEFDTKTTNVWKPKPYTGGFGTNGFHLNYSIAPGTGNGAGSDVSGNGNHFTDNNLTSIDKVKDSPTQNYPIFTLVDDHTRLFAGNAGAAQGGPILRDGNLFCDYFITSLQPAVEYYTTFQEAAVTGKVYFEFFSVLRTSQVAYPNISTNGLSTLPVNTGNTLGIAINYDTGETWYHLNGTWNNGVGVGGVPDGTFTPNSPFLCRARNHGSPQSKCSINFGQRPFNFLANQPAGFRDINSLALAAPTICQPAEFFTSISYIGSGTTRTIKGMKFNPKLTWIKNRDNSDNHAIQDALRGPTKKLVSNTDAAEITTTSGLTLFGPGGFDLGDGTSDSGYNNLNERHIAWNWRADSSANGTTGGVGASQSYSTQFSAVSGFSIVSYTGNGSGGHTIPHHLGAVPQMMIIKQVNGVSNWVVYHQSMGVLGPQNGPQPNGGDIGELYRIQLNTNDAKTTDSSIWNDTKPTSSAFTIGTSATVNTNGQNYIAYIFAPIEGYSRFSNHFRTTNLQGEIFLEPFRWCGFKPAYLLIKRVDAASNWTILDSSRDTFSVIDSRLFTNIADIETLSDSVDFLSNGYKLRTTDSEINANGEYIVAAFAQSSFKLGGTEHIDEGFCTSYLDAGNFTYEVPTGITKIEITTWGAGGGAGTTGSKGGGGGFMGGLLDVTPGETLDIIIGSGGGAGTGSPNFGGAGGGGYSAVKRSTTFLTLAGGGAGGGGGGAGQAGGGGGTLGGNGQNSTSTNNVSQGGFGGTQVAGGAGGVSTAVIPRFNGAAGSAFNGGDGATSGGFLANAGSPGGGRGGFYTSGAGGGGGAGFFGGGGGSSGGTGSGEGGGATGGGGSGFIDVGATNVTQSTATTNVAANDGGGLIGSAGFGGTGANGFDGQITICNFVEFNIIISANTNNFNLTTELINQGWDGITPAIVDVTINSGITVGSTLTTTAAFVSGELVPRAIVTITNNGRIQGRGGNGSVGAGLINFGVAGLPGGTAINTTIPITVDNSSGEIWGAGGGGGGGGASTPVFMGQVSGSGGGGGGGGAGTNPGIGSPGGPALTTPGSPGADGTATSGGAGGGAGPIGGAGGSGGNPGLVGSAGVNGAFSNGGAGGAAGNAIDGISFVTFVGVGSILGPQI